VISRVNANGEIKVLVEVLVEALAEVLVEVEGSLRLIDKRWFGITTGARREDGFDEILFVR
jgi:hypothetical protein